MSDTKYIDSYRWPPLESDPSIFNKCFQEVGLPDFIGFQELTTLDPKEIQHQVSDFPIFGVIAALNRSKIEYSEENIMDWNSIPFYMKQTRELDSACGLIAALHIFGNNKDDFCLSDESILKKFFIGATTISDYQRAKYLEDFTELKLKHQAYANQGQSFLPNVHDANSKKSVTHHYVSYANIDNNLVELDGTLPGPLIIKKKISKENFLLSVVEEIQTRINKGVVGEDLSILFLTYI